MVRRTDAGGWGDDPPPPMRATPGCDYGRSVKNMRPAKEPRWKKPVFCSLLIRFVGTEKHGDEPRISLFGKKSVKDRYFLLGRKRYPLRGYLRSASLPVTGAREEGECSRPPSCPSPGRDNEIFRVPIRPDACLLCTAGRRAPDTRRSGLGRGPCVRHHAPERCTLFAAMGYYGGRRGGLLMFDWKEETGWS